MNRRLIQCAIAVLATSAFPAPAQTFTVTGTVPAANALDVPRTADVTVVFSEPLNTQSVDATTFRAWGRQTGFGTGTYTFGSATFRQDPPFKPGEEVEVMLGSGIVASAGAHLRPHVSRFVVEAAGQEGFFFEDSAQILGGGTMYNVALGDLDGDGDLDALMARQLDNQVWTNDGAGHFSDSGRTAGSGNTREIALGDLDADGDVDAFVANGCLLVSCTGTPNEVWLNDGTGTFTDSLQRLGWSASQGVGLGDLDGDGDLDAFVANELREANVVWLNDGGGGFFDSGQALGAEVSYDIVLGDLDGDGDLDAFVVNNGSNTVWVNDGRGVFTNSGQALGNRVSYSAALGDLDADGHLDVFVAENGANTVWRNDGSGLLQDTAQSLGSAVSLAVALGDLDGDGDLDAFTADTPNAANLVWLNDGTGFFRDSGMRLGLHMTQGAALGDLDGDGDLDAFEVNSAAGGGRVWINAVASDLSVVKTDAPDPVVAGSNLTYTLAVSNGGPSLATCVTVVDTLPTSVVFQSASPGYALSSNTVTWVPGSLSPGAATTLTVSATLQLLPIYEISNEVSVSAAEPDPVPLNNTFLESTAVRPLLPLDIAGSPEPHGAPAPLGYGTHPVATDTVVTNSVGSPADTSNGTRYVCAGWTRTGSSPGAGPGASATFTFTTNTTLTWLWQREFELLLVALGGSITGEGEGYKTEGLGCDLFPMPYTGRVFDHWEINGAGAGATVPLHVVMDGPKTVEAVFSALFTNVSNEVTTEFVDWYLSRQSGTLFGTLRLCARTNASKHLVGPFWYVAESNAVTWLMQPDGIEPESGYPYVDITAGVNAALTNTGNGDLVLDPGECVLVPGIEFYSRYRTPPAGFVVAVWADPPVPWADADGDGMTDVEEGLAGTDPFDPCSCLRFTGAGGEGGARYIEWVGGTSAVQYLDGSRRLGAWMCLYTNRPPTPVTNRYLRRRVVPEAGYFRLRAAPETP